MANGSASKKKASASTGADNQEKHTGTQLERKLTNKLFYGEKPKAPESDKYLATVYGIARGTQSGESQNGPWTCLTGTFEAHTHDGRKLAAPKVFLPDPLNSSLAEQLADENVESIQFAVDVYIVPSDVPIGYEYRTKTKVDPSGADPLADLRRQALPAPE